jgi:hypothetical protein
MLYAHDYGSEEMRDLRAADVQHPAFEVTMLCVPPDHARTYTPEELRALWTRFVTDWPEAAAVLREPATPEVLTALDFGDRGDQRVTFGELVATRRRWLTAGWEAEWAWDARDRNRLALVGVRVVPGARDLRQGDENHA